MSHLRTLQPDPSDHPEQPRAVPDELAERESAAFLTRLTNTLAEHGGGAVSADLAADLVLNQIVEQARMATTATAAAIALTRGDEMVCRATTGPNAPDLGVRLTTDAGISGACVTTREVQRCDDTETDPRVDAAACRELGIRSMLVVPVLDAEKLVGVFEILSPRPHAFGDRDVQTLEALSLRIVSTLHRAIEPVPTPMPPTVIAIDEATRSNNYVPELLSPPAPVQTRDYWTTILTAIVVALALLLGWMLGRASWQSAMGKRLGKTIQTPADTRPQPEVSTQDRAITPPIVARTNVGESSPKSKSAAAPPDDALVVYQNGKVIFRASPVQKASTKEPATAEDAGGELVPAPSGPVVMSPEIAGRYLIQRVEPEYPDDARLQRIQGDVVMDAIVAKDGNVREVKPISGDSHLAAAAVDAVRQWRFKPYTLEGQPVEFQTRVVVKFALP
jgi:TonB family protein